MTRTHEQHAQREATYSTGGCGAQQRWFERAGAQTGHERSRAAQDQAAATPPTHRSPLPRTVSAAMQDAGGEATTGISGTTSVPDGSRPTTTALVGCRPSAVRPREAADGADAPRAREATAPSGRR